MIVRMGLLTRKPGVSNVEFRHHWRDIHGPLASRLPSLRGYHQNHVVDNLWRPDDFTRGKWSLDGISELWFDSVEDMRGAVHSDAYDAVARDHVLFVGDTGLITAEQHVVVPISERDRRSIKVISLLSRAQHVDGETFRREWLNASAELIASVPGLIGYTQNLILDREIRPGTSVPHEMLPVDGIAEFWFENTTDLRHAFASPEAIRMREHGRSFIGSATNVQVETQAIV